MSTRPHARPRRAAPRHARWALLAIVGHGCAQSSLDEPTTATSHGEPTTGDSLPPLETGAAETTEAASTGAPEPSDDPRLCPSQCPIALPLQWAYDGATPSRPDLARPHVTPVMLRGDDGSLVVAELRDGQARLHRLDAAGRLQWNVPLPLPCDVCELTDLAPHPSGDLLLSASGTLRGGPLELYAARYDAVRHALVWLTSSPLTAIEGASVRSGAIGALPGDVVAQLYMDAEVDFDVLQHTAVIAYDSEGSKLEEESLLSSSVTTSRHPLVGRATPDGEMLVALVDGSPGSSFGLVSRLSPPLWSAFFAFVPTTLDDVTLDARGHAIELGHSFDDGHAYLQLRERAGVDPTPRWTASLAVPSTTSTPGAVALGPDGDVYAALRTTQAPAGAEPLAGVSLSRWTSEGELRWHTTLLWAVAETFNPIELAIDDEGGLVLAAIVDDQLRVERRAQTCGCAS